MGKIRGDKLKKIFLYLYPIEEYTKMFLFQNDKLYDDCNVKRPLPILNECIQKRYRDKGYQVVFALYPDRNIFGIIPKKEDKVILTDVSFDEARACYSDGTQKKNFVPKYPNEKLLLSQLGNIDELVIGGYHSSDCVKRVGEKALNMGIDTLVDLELTDLFFALYKQEDYFKIEEYNPLSYKQYILNRASKYGDEFAKKHFNDLYSSPVYGFSNEEIRHKK